MEIGVNNLSDQLKVDPDGLDEFASGLERISDRLNGTDGWMLEFENELGGADVDDALDEFESHWNDGRKQVDKNCKSLAEAARKGAEKFRETDRGLAGMLTEEQQ